MEIWGGNTSADDAISVPGVDAWIYSQPFERDDSGGDIHYVSMCGAGKISRFVIADVSGHGSGVSELAVFLRDQMRRHINTLDQARFARSLNTEFTRHAKAGVFATSIAATYFAPTDHLVVCNAGHPRPLRFSAQRDAWEFLGESGVFEHEEVGEVGNLPLGIIEPTSYLQYAVSLAPGDLIVLYTDSLIETPCKEGGLLGESGLLDVVARVGSSRPESFSGDLLAEIESTCGAAPSNDDVTVLVLHHNASNPPKQSLGEKMRVMARLVGLQQV